MPTAIHLPGVPHVFTDAHGLVGFLKFSPGYVQHQWQYLAANHPAELRAAGYTSQPLGRPAKPAPSPLKLPPPPNPNLPSRTNPTGSGPAKGRNVYPRQKPTPLHLGFSAAAGLAGGVKALSEIGQAVEGMPAGAVLAVRHPVGAAQQMAKGFAESAQHPLRHPGFTALNALAVGSLGLGAAAKVGEIGQAGSLGEAARIAVRPRVTAPRELHLGGGVKVQRFPSRNPLTQKVLARRDVTMQQQLEGGGLAGPSGRNVLSPQAAAGRELSRQHEIRLAQAQGPAKAFERFAHGPEKLTPAEEKAYETIARGHTPETMFQHHLSGAKVQAERGDTAAAQAHGEGAVLARVSADLIRNPSPKLATALDEARALIAKREQDLGMTKDEVAHSIGKAHDEIAALAEGRPSLSQRLAEAEGAVTTEAPKDLAKAIRETEAKLAANRAQQARFKPPPRTAERAVITPGPVPERLPPRLGPGTVKGLPTDATLRKLRREESDLSTKLTELRAHEHIATVKSQITAVGKTAQANGAFYLKTARFPELRGGPPAVQRSPGPTGFGPPKIPRQKVYTGAAQRRGVYRTDVAKLTAEASRQATRIAHARDYAWPTMLKLAKDSKEEAGGKYAVPVREKTAITPELRERLAHAHNPKEFPEAHQNQLDELMQHVNPPEHLVDPATNTIRGTKEKVKWVDSRLVHGLLTKSAPGFSRLGGRTVNVGSVLDTLNAPARFGTLFLKPSYYWNRVQQGLQNAVQQGLFLPANGHLLKRVAAENPVQDYYTIKSLVGTGRSRAIIPEGGPLRERMTRSADWWSRLTDDKSRELSFIHEARREGFNTPEKIHALLTDPGNKAALERVTIRARHEAIPFGKMSPIEKETIARAMFFYPWTRAAIEYTARFPGEHPVQAALGTQTGRQGEAETQKLFRGLAGAQAHLPGWAQALTFWQSHGAHPLSSDFSNLNTPQTAVDTAQMLTNLGKKPNQQTGQTIAGELGPLFAAGYGLASGTSRGRAASSALAGAVGGYLGSTPAVTFQRRLKGTGTYPGGWLPATAGYFGGPEVPRPTGAAALATGGEQERRAQLTPEQRIADDSRLDRANLRTALVKAGYPEYKAKLTPQLQQAFTLRTERRAAIVKAGVKAGTPTYQHDAWKVDVGLLLQRGEIDKQTAGNALTWGAKATEDAVRSERARLGQEYFGGAAITDVVQLLHEKGIHYSYR